MKKILFVLMAMIAFFSCGASDGSTSSNPNEKVLTYNAVAEGISFDPQILTDGNTMTIHGLVSEGLTYTMPSGEVKPALAESWEISEDGLTWTFKLRDGIKWSNGEAITADDFVFGWQRALDPKNATEYAYILFPIKNAEKYASGEVAFEEVGIKAIDEKTLEVKLENVTPYFDSLVSFITYMPANRKFAEEKGADYGLEADTLLYSGPYKVVKWDHNTQLELERNEHYYAPESRKIDRYVIKYIADSTAALNAFNNGEIDIVSITTEQLQEYKDDARLKINGLARTFYLAFNLENEIFKNQKIREAISLAVDKEGLIETVFNGAKEASYTFTPKNIGMLGVKEDFVKELGPTFAKFDAEKAKVLFEEGKKELGITDFLTITFLADERGSNKKIVEKIQEDLRVNLGIELNVEIVTFKERLNRTTARGFDIVLTGWGADYQDPMTFLDLLISKSGNNAPHYYSSEYDALISAALKTTNREERMKNLFEAERLLAKDVPIIPLYQETQLHLVNEAVKGLEIGSFGIDLHFFNVDK
ncbi:peptide ABC transporter substrate-binding protein [Streptobacillus felis]|uniref:peptide ABC transporter substrate-binding protein n=1 Tax=Streptobacillus felis TaxID=1384509 RepID=UPI000829E8EE|nr:peptide ABC transporter substrate-binding protein [Streptobacillus felis]